MGGSSWQNLVFDKSHVSPQNQKRKKNRKIIYIIFEQKNNIWGAKCLTVMKTMQKNKIK